MNDAFDFATKTNLLVHVSVLEAGGRQQLNYIK